MFGQMNVESLLYFGNGQGRPAPELETAVARLLELTEHPKVARWLQFPAAVLVFLVVPEDPCSGAFYVYERRKGAWFWIDFEDQNFGGYSLADFDRLVRQSHFLTLVEQPWLLECDGKWFVQPGESLRCRFDCA